MSSSYSYCLNSPPLEQLTAASAASTSTAAREIRIIAGDIVQKVHVRATEAQRAVPAKPLLYLIDGSSQMYRAFHAPIRTADGGMLRNAAGMPTNAVYIFVTMLRKLIADHKPEYIAASFDLPGRTFRDDLVSDYKANRAAMRGERPVQIPMVHAAC